MDYTAPLDEEGLVIEVAGGTFCFMNKIKPASIKLLWDKLSRFILESLKQSKGVLLPNLGTFRVGPVVGEAKKKIRPCFALLETRYSGVSQERVKYNIGGRCAIVQPNFGLLATAAGVHRGACQRLVAELLQHLGVHVLSGRPLKVGFPGLGKLVTNRASRIDFVFEPLLLEYFELERHNIIPEMSLDMPDADGGDQRAVLGQVVKGLQHVHLENPPNIRSRPQTNASASTPGARAKAQAHAPYRNGLMELYKLCKTNDKINSGCVPRLTLEQWLNKECRSALAHVDAATVLQLLSKNTYGKTGKHILYKQFLDGLEAATGNVTPLELSPQNVQSPRRVVEVQLDMPWHNAGEQEQADMQQQQDAGEVTFGAGAQHGMQMGPGLSYGMQPMPGSPYPAQQQQPYQAQQQQQAGAWHGGQQWQQSYPQQQQQQPYPQQQQPYPQQQQPYPQQQPPGTAWGAPAQTPVQNVPGLSYGVQPQPSQWPSSAQQQQQGYGGQLRPPPIGVPGTPMQQPGTAGPSPSRTSPPLSINEPEALMHYYQNQLSPRSRSDYDRFNKMHFDKLQQVRGKDYKRAVTPKVGEEALNVQEYHAMRLTGDRLPTPAEVLGRKEQPYSYTPQAVTNSPGNKAAGPPPQILTLAHASYDTPSSGQRPPRPPSAAWQQLPQQQRMQTPQQASVPTPSSANRQQQPISQYDIMNEQDPVLRQRMRDGRAQVVRQEWKEQIREKERVQYELNAAEAQWPYAPTQNSHDKRPISAVNRARSPFQRAQSFS